MPTIAKKIVAVAAVCAIAALSAQAESPVAAENGIRMSEWGNKPVLPEVESSAPARKAEAESVLPELGEFLSEEWQTLGAGATDTDRLRKALANRATGQADDSLMSFMTSRWESAPGRLANFLTDHAETRLNAMPGIENAALDLTPGDDGNGFGFSASGVGVLHSSASAAFGIQPKIERASEDGILRGSFGAFQRKAIGGAVVGVNAFADFTSHPVRGEASRWRFGADFASPWVDANVQKYVGGLGERYYHGGELHQAYTPHGTAAEIRVHSPDLRWLEGFARFSETEGRGGNADTRTHGFGLAFQPHFGGLSGWRTNAEWTGGEDLNVALNYAWTLGEGAALPSVSDPFNVYTDLTNPAIEITEANIASYNIKAYEGAALWELGYGIGSVTFSADYDPSQWGGRQTLAWLLVPEYLRVEGPYARYCPPPIISVGRVDGYTGGGCLGKLFGGRDTNQNLYAGMHWVHVLAFWTAGTSDRIDGGIVDDVDYLRYEILAGFDANLLVSDDHPLYPGYSALDILQEGDGDWAGLTDAELKAKFPWLDPTWEWFVEARHYLLKFAKILKANGGTCVKKTEGFLCNIEAPGWEKYVPELPPEGGLLPVPKVVVAEGYTGEVFRVTATTAYADVDFTYTGLGNSFTATIAGSFQSFSSNGSNPWFTNGRYHNGDTTVAIVRLTNSALPVGTYEIQVTADFFYHHNDLNVATRVVTVEVVDKQQTIREYANEDGSAALTSALRPELVNMSARRTSQLPHLNFANGEFSMVRNLNLGEGFQADFAVTADNLHGEINLDYTVTLSYYDDKAYLQAKYDLDCDTPDPSKVDLSPDTSLLAAVSSTNETSASRACDAVAAGANLNQHIGHNSLLSRAIADFNIPMQRILFSHGADVDFKGRVFGYGRPIHAAARSANLMAAKHLLGQEEVSPDDAVSLDNPNHSNSYRPIHALGNRQVGDTAQRGKPFELAELLVRHGVNVNGPDSDNKTYLHYVAKNGEHESMDPILGVGPDATIETTSDHSLALTRAIKNHRDEVVEKLLVTRGRIIIDVNQRESDSGRAAIHYAATREQVDMLVCAGAKLDLTVGGDIAGNDYGQTALAILQRDRIPVRQDWITHSGNETNLSYLCAVHAPGIYDVSAHPINNP